MIFIHSLSSLPIESQLLVVMRDLLVGGIDPTLAAVRWGLLKLATHPEAQKRMQSEIDAHFARDEMPRYFHDCDMINQILLCL